MAARRSAGDIWRVARFGFDQLFWSSRTLAMGALALCPLVVALVYSALVGVGVEVPTSAFAFFSAVTATIGFGFVAPVLSLFYASGIMSDDIEAGTMSYYLTRPVPRSSFLGGKMLGSLVISLLLFLPPLVLAYYVTLSTAGWKEIGAHFPSLLRELLAGVLGLCAYNGLFALAGVGLRRPLVAGLVFVFGWQAAATYVPGVLRYLTVTHFLHSLLPSRSLPGGLAGLLSERSTVLEAAAVLLVLAVATHAAAIWLFHRKEL